MKKLSFKGCIKMKEMVGCNDDFLQAGTDKRVNNFGKDISDSVAYTHLIHQISPKESGVHKNALGKSDLMERAEETLEQADKIGCR